MNKHKISLVIFDMDGLMFDTERIGREAWQKAGEALGIEIKPQFLLEIIGMNVKGAERVFEKYYGNSLTFYDLRNLRVKYGLDYIEKNGMPVKPGLFELLDYLDNRGIMKAVATSTERKRAEKYLSMAGITDRFDTIVCGDEVTYGKPEPDIFIEAAKRTGCKVEECIVLEDSANGIKAASKAKMLPVLIPDIRRPDEVEKLVYRELKSLHDVIDLLESSKKN
ncbi:HAD family hydrolase [Acetivibrio mesophilus]|uniref:HAD family phosphatase n=1 Tax=Acetivibrio mesophilus TaxID=2487273 RepID=A0A4V1K1Y9_9FIRM|nr:HAD family phosphatase [Acetivibrio mesophilus]ODM25369.1 HAD family hydrolase [Clostridium sp. Bc-iso-3]RXE58449.1 HAD family phosphatase [Acetivibrio mesophilus]HHV28673.1 HAD family phosphatase [Clostridium sp.]